MSESSLSPGPLSWIIVCWTGNKPSPRNSVRLDSMLMLLSFAFCKAFYFNLITLLTLQNISVWLNWFIVNIGVKNILCISLFTVRSMSFLLPRPPLTWAGLSRVPPVSRVPASETLKMISRQRAIGCTHSQPVSQSTQWWKHLTLMMCTKLKETINRSI